MGFDRKVGRHESLQHQLLHNRCPEDVEVQHNGGARLGRSVFQRSNQSGRGLLGAHQKRGISAGVGNL
jgi:hypothetical protein